MADTYKIIYEGGQGEIVEKKSRFIAHVQPVHSEEEATAFLEQIRKKHWDARHNCYAFVIGSHDELQRCSDDGEPSGTAGKPILEVLHGEHVHDVIIVVTRYFGGTLLGTGGLVRAYQAASKAGLQAATVIEKIAGVHLKIITDYTGLGKIQYILGQRGIPLYHSEYTEKVSLEILLDQKEEKSLRKELTEATAGQADIEKTDTCYFAIIDNKPEKL